MFCRVLPFTLCSRAPRAAISAPGSVGNGHTSSQASGATATSAYCINDTHWSRMTMERSGKDRAQNYSVRRWSARIYRHVLLSFKVPIDVVLAWCIGRGQRMKKPINCCMHVCGLRNTKDQTPTATAFRPDAKINGVSSLPCQRQPDECGSGPNMQPRRHEC